MSEKKKYKVTLLLSRYDDAFSKLIALSSGCIFTHISISVDPEENVFYSFNLKGFIEEHWHNKKSRHLMPEREYMHLYVDKKTFQKLKCEICRFAERKQELSYSVFGTLLCMARIPHSFKKKYFCSRFVAEVLKNSGILHSKRKNSLFLPIHLFRELKAQKA